MKTAEEMQQTSIKEISIGDRFEIGAMIVEVTDIDPAVNSIEWEQVDGDGESGNMYVKEAREYENSHGDFPPDGVWIRTSDDRAAGL